MYLGWAKAQHLIFKGIISQNTLSIMTNLIGLLLESFNQLVILIFFFCLYEFCFCLYEFFFSFYLLRRKKETVGSKIR